MFFQIIDNSISTIEFKLLFTPSERVQLRELAKTDPFVADMFELLDDIRTQSINLLMPQLNEMLSYLVTESVLTEERKQQILSAQLPDANQSVITNLVSDVELTNDTPPTE